MTKTTILVPPNPACPLPEIFIDPKATLAACVRANLERSLDDTTECVVANIARVIKGSFEGIFPNCQRGYIREGYEHFVDMKAMASTASLRLRTFSTNNITE
jgi:hypothetical protein